MILFGLPAPDRLLASSYGKLLLLKLAFFAGMLLLAASNRWRLTPALGAALGSGGVAPALSRLRTSLLAEGAAALAILGLVAWFGTLEPPIAAG
jgi:putative copper resistance protein D